MIYNCINKVITLLLFCMAISACEKDHLFKDPEAELERIMSNHELPSLVAGIVSSDELVWAKSYGEINLSQHIPADSKSIYHLGSISKLFVLTAIMQLKEQGLLNLDEDINHYLPFFIRHPEYPEIPLTTRMLLTHQAGLAWPQSYDGEQGMWNLFPPDQAPSPSEWIPEFLVTTGDNYDPNLWKTVQPGTYELYSNIGINIVAYLVEQISDQDFRDYCKAFIFEPLEMHSTSYNYADLNMNNLALLYDFNNTPSNYFDDRLYASGGAKSTISDMAKFATCYLNNGVYHGYKMLNSSTVEEIMEIQNPASGRCLVWEAFQEGWFGHTGGLIRGASTTFIIHPQTNSAIIIFTNAHSGRVSPGGDIFWLLKQLANTFIE